MGYGDFVEASNLKQNGKLQKELKGETVEEETSGDSQRTFAKDCSEDLAIYLLFRTKTIHVGRCDHSAVPRWKASNSSFGWAHYKIYLLYSVVYQVEGQQLLFRISSLQGALVLVIRRLPSEKYAVATVSPKNDGSLYVLSSGLWRTKEGMRDAFVRGLMSRSRLAKRAWI
eukprot:jgi/Phyca11/13167/fgenesh1_pg.PHYCAscaffold_2_\